MTDLGDATGASAVVTDGELHLAGTGSSLYRGASNAAFLYDEVSGDFRIEVDVTGVPVDVGGDYRKGVLMVRSSTDPFAAQVMVQYVPQHRGAGNEPALQFDYRDAEGQSGTLASIFSGISLPVRLAVQRVGDVFTVSLSEDGGLHWIHPSGGAKGSIEIDMGPTVLAGVAVASYDSLRAMTVAFDDLGICQPEGPVPTEASPNCPAEQPLDLVYVVDTSDSMARPHGGAGSSTSKLNNARDAMLRLHETLALVGDGSRASLVTYSGLRNEPLWNQASGAVLEAGPSTDPALLATALQALDSPVLDPYEPDTATPLALAIDRAKDLLLDEADPTLLPTVILVADGVPNLDGRGRGSRQYPEAEVAPISLLDENGDFFAPQSIAWLGGFNPQLDTFDGRVLADAMDAAQRLREAVPGARIFVLVPCGSEANPPVSPETLFDFFAFATGGAVYGGETAAQLEALVPSLATAARCGAVGPGFVEGRLWRDSDGDGSADPGEAGLPGVVMTLEAASGETRSTVTDLDGSYRFAGVAAASHTVLVDSATLPPDADLPVADLDGVETPHRTSIEVPGWSTVRADFGYSTAAGRGLYGCVEEDYASAGLESEWQIARLGDASIGEAFVSAGRLEITGDGGELFETADDAVFHTRTSSGDFRFEMTLESISGDGAAFRKAGLMVRAGLHPDDPRLMVQYSPDYESGRTALQFRYRESFGGDGREEVASDRFDLPLPVRLAIEREGDLFTVSYSTDDGLTWNIPGGAAKGSVTLDLGPSPWIGASVTSYAPDEPMTAVFDDLSLCSLADSTPPSGGPSVSIQPPAPEDLGRGGDPSFEVGYTAAAGSVGVARVELFVDGVRVGGSDLSPASIGGTLELPADLDSSPDGSVEVKAVVWQLEIHGGLSWGEAATTIVLDRRAPEITILEPAADTVADSSSIQLRVSIDEASTVDLFGTVQDLASPGELSQAVPLLEGTNLLVVRATDAAGNSAVETVRVLRDSFPPRVHLRHPERGDLVVGRPGEALTTTVIGSVSDLVTGAVNAGDCTVTVNGVPAIVDNGDFVAFDVPVAVGKGTITAVAEDRSGQKASAFVEVVGLSSPNAILEVVSGDAQAGAVGSLLPAPLVVRAISNAGEPVAGVPVHFAVKRGDGELAGGIGGGVRRKTIITGADGTASISWALGSRIGAASDQVSARADGFLGEAEFCAGAAVSPAARATLSLVMGTNQRGAVGDLAALPLTVRLSDEHGNSIAGRAIEFEVLAGEGRVDGVTQISKTTDDDGRAFVLQSFGSTPGINSQVVVARYGIGSVTFVSSAFEPGDPADTAMRGTVLDNTGQPIAGVAVSVTDLLTMSSGPDGRFSILGVPEGHIHLVVDGSTAGPYPHLEYELDITSGLEHAMPRPIYLPRVDQDGKALVGAERDAVITRADTPGLEMRIPAGSTTFADGSTEGEVQIIRVQRDKLPMEPPEGTAPRIAFSIQPAGAHFDPPAAIRFPNVEGLAPGRVVSIYSFDHDLGEYVSVGTAQVTEDGAYVASEAGQGIVKGGWHLVPPAPAVVGSLNSSCGTVRCTESGCELCRDFDCSICDPIDSADYLAVFGAEDAPDTPDVDCYTCPTPYGRGDLGRCTNTARVLPKPGDSGCIRGLDQQFGLTGKAGDCRIPSGETDPVCCPTGHWDGINEVCCATELAQGEECN